LEEGQDEVFRECMQDGDGRRYLHKRRCVGIDGFCGRDIGWRRQDRGDHRRKRPSVGFQRARLPDCRQIGRRRFPEAKSRYQGRVTVCRSSKQAGYRFGDRGKWFDVDGVDAIADVGNSAVGLALQTIIRDKNKIAIYTSVATTALTGKQCVKTGFAWLHDAYTLVAGPLRTLVAQGQDTWFFVAADYEFGKNMVAESQRLLQRVGGKSLGAVYHPMTNADYSSFLLQAQSSGAKVVAFSNVGDQLVNSMKQWKESGMDAGKQRPVAQLLFLTDVHSMGLDVAAGLTSMVGWYWGLNDETRVFGHRFFERHKRMPTAPQAAVYSGVLHFLKAVAATGSDDTDTVAKWMRENAVDDFYARGAKIREDGKLIHPFYLIEVKKKADVKEPWDYYNILRQVPPDEAFLPLSESECPLVKASN
jgi:branched-chain amino acid transport system substrate-binding protein